MNEEKIKQIQGIIEDLIEMNNMDGYHAGYDEAWDEARSKGFDEGFEEADEQNSKYILERDEKIVSLEEELEMMHERSETSYNEGFEDGEDEERAVHDRLRWEEVSDAIPNAYAEGFAEALSKIEKEFPGSDLFATPGSHEELTAMLTTWQENGPISVGFVLNFLNQRLKELHRDEMG